MIHKLYIKAKERVLFFSLCVAFFSLIGDIQGQNNVLSIPPVYFTPGSSRDSLPTQWPGYFVGSTYVWGYDGQPAKHNHNAMQDAQGNLLFFMVDNYVYDKKGYYINTISSAQEICIVPDPGNCQRYYIFYSSQGTYPQPYYSILDLSISHSNTPATGQMGDFVAVGGQTILSIAPMIPNYYSWFRLRPGFAASKLRSDNSRFVYNTPHFLYHF